MLCSHLASLFIALISALSAGSSSSAGESATMEFNSIPASIADPKRRIATVELATLLNAVLSGAFNAVARAFGHVSLAALSKQGRKAYAFD
jgi:hypothetical protein